MNRWTFRVPSRSDLPTDADEESPYDEDEPRQPGPVGDWLSRRINASWHTEAVTAGYDPFNPLAESNVARSVQAALLSVPAVPLVTVPAFYGSGIYVLYYSGNNRLYTPINDGSWPIYVGKASPEGARKGATRARKRAAANELDRAYGRSLWSRLREHAVSINIAADLSLFDFTCRYLVTTSAFVALSETLMIDWFSPVWNLVTDGFGSHDPGGGRRVGAIPKWDTLHPGRSWVEQHDPATAAEHDELVRAVQQHFIDHPPRPGDELPEATLRRAAVDSDSLRRAAVDSDSDGTGQLPFDSQDS
jgi:hypothetical protein